MAVEKGRTCEPSTRENCSVEELNVSVEELNVSVEEPTTVVLNLVFDIMFSPTS